jgi:hypothetical protein
MRPKIWATQTGQGGLEDPRKEREEIRVNIQSRQATKIEKLPGQRKILIHIRER